MSAVKRAGLILAVMVLIVAAQRPVLAEPPGLGPAGDLQRIEFETLGPEIGRAHV